MTRFGKILVFVNLTISLMLMMWAMSTYANRIDWSDNKAKEKEGIPAGELVASLARVKDAWSPLPTAESDWRAARQNLLTQEERRRDTRRWYDAELAKLDKDPNPKAPTLLREIRVDKAGLPDLDAGPPDPQFKTAYRIKMEPVNDRTGKALLAWNLYDLQETEHFVGNDMKEGLAAARTRLRKAVEENVESITRIIGPKGLHVVLENEKTKRQGVSAEYKSVEPLLIYDAASSQFAIERKIDLAARVKELEERRSVLRRKLGVAGE